MHPEFFSKPSVSCADSSDPYPLGKFDQHHNTRNYYTARIFLHAEFIGSMFIFSATKFKQYIQMVID